MRRGEGHGETLGDRAALDVDATPPPARCSRRAGGVEVRDRIAKRGPAPPSPPLRWHAVAAGDFGDEGGSTAASKLWLSLMWRCRNSPS